MLIFFCFFVVYCILLREEEWDVFFYNGGLDVSEFDGTRECFSALLSALGVAVKLRRVLHEARARLDDSA